MLKLLTQPRVPLFFRAKAGHISLLMTCLGCFQPAFAAPNSVDHRNDLAGTWQGTYLCGGYSAEMTLKIEQSIVTMLRGGSLTWRREKPRHSSPGSRSAFRLSSAQNI